MTVAKPYMEKIKGPQKPSRDAAPDKDHRDMNKRSASDVQIKDVISGESLGFKKIGSVAPGKDYSDSDDGDGNEVTDESKRRVEKEIKSNQNQHQSFQSTPLPATDPSIVSVSKWPTQTRRELPVNKSIEQESWHNQNDQGAPRVVTYHTDENESERDSSVRNTKSHQNEDVGWRNGSSQRKTTETLAESETLLSSSYPDLVSSGDIRHRASEEQMTTKPSSQQKNQKSTSLIEKSNTADEESDSSSVAENRKRIARESSTHSPTIADSERRKSPNPSFVDQNNLIKEKENKSSCFLPPPLPLKNAKKQFSLRTGKEAGDSAEFPPNSMLPVASSWETAVSEGLQVQSREMENEKRNPIKLNHAEKSFERKKNNMGYIRSKGKREARPASMPLPQNQFEDLQKKSNNENINRPNSLSQSVDETHVKRSISWSAAVSGNGKPPRPRSISSAQSSILMPNLSSAAAEKSKSQRSSKTKENSMSTSFKDIPVTSLDFDGHVALPPLSEYALKTGVIMEGWVEKKSSMTGFWQKVQISGAFDSHTEYILC